MTSDYYVFVSDTPFTSADLSTTLSQSGVSNYYHSGFSGPTSSAGATSVNINRTGRYLRVQLTGTNSLALAEVQVWSQAAKLEWLVTDQLGTPRIAADKTGTLAGVSRHDYLPFGEDLSVGRSTVAGYSTADGVRQKFTDKERDNESGLDYFGARYYASMQGRFTSVDPVFVRLSRLNDPQRWNLYGHARENPIKYLDPDGRDLVPTNDQSAAQLKADFEMVMHKAEMANIKVVAGKNVGIIDPGAIDLNTASRAYRGLLEVIKPGITRNYSTATAGQDVVLADGSKRNVGSGATFVSSDDPTRIDIYVPDTDAPKVWGEDGRTPIKEPRFMVTAHEIFGESACGGGQCAVNAENEIRDDIGLPRRSGSDHEPLRNEIHPPLTIPPTEVNIAGSETPIPVQDYQPTNLQPGMRPIRGLIKPNQ
jgi:RHS repeat-associated protein